MPRTSEAPSAEAAAAGPVDATGSGHAATVGPSPLPPGPPPAGVQTAPVVPALKAAAAGGAVALELCAGTAALSAALRSFGLDAFGVDHSACRHRHLAPCIMADLSSAEGQRHVWHLITSLKPCFIHAAPPCGTASRAREIPLPAGMRRLGAPAPRPLRSAAFPRGLPALTATEQLKVSQANKIYDFLAAVVCFCLSQDIVVSVENPRSSWLWHLPAFAALQEDRRMMKVDFQQCAHGGDRPKWTTWFTNHAPFSRLAATCPGDHAHKPWGVSRGSQGWHFATADEAAYPRALCVAVAEVVRDHAATRGLALLQPKRSSSGVVAAAAGRLSRHTGQPVSEYGRIVTLSFDTSACPAVGDKLPASETLAPAGAKILSRRRVEGGIGGSATLAPAPGERFAASPSNEGLCAGLPGDHSAHFVAEVGVFRTPEVFLDEARVAPFPMDILGGLPDRLLHVLFEQLVSGPEASVRRQVNALRRVVELGKSLEAEERDLHASLPAFLEGVYNKKRLLLFERLLADVGHGDRQLVPDMVRGFELTGCPNPSGLFPPKVVPGELSAACLRRIAGVNNEAVLASVGPSLDPAADDELWEATCKDISNGWLMCPVSVADLNETFPDGWVCSRRFPVKQGSKTRAIDDYSASQVNSCFTSVEKLQLHTADHVAALARVMSSAADASGRVRLRVSGGGVLEGTLHPGWRAAGALDVVGTTVDLRAAYRQLGVAPSGRWAAPVAVWNPRARQAQVYVPLALPFGATSSVYAFNRAARGVWTLLLEVARAPVLNFYDDYPCLSFRALARSTETAVLALLRFLGWPTSDDKRPPFAEDVAALGVVFRLGAPDREYLVVNKPGRVEDIMAEIERVLAEGRLTPSRAAALVGRLGFAESQLFGRFLRLGAPELYRRAYEASASAHVDPPLKAALEWLAQFLPRAGGRRVARVNEDEPAVLIFTDGACEGTKVTVGGVLVDGEAVEYFGFDVAGALVNEWSGWVRGKQVIGQAELYPVWLSRIFWGRRLAGRKVVHYVDNEAARFGFIKGHSDSSHSCRLLRAIASCPPPWPAAVWVARVPSASNPADGPSRLDFAWVASLPGARRVTPPQPSSFVSQAELDRWLASERLADWAEMNGVGCGPSQRATGAA